MKCGGLTTRHTNPERVQYEMGSLLSLGLAPQTEMPRDIFRTITSRV